MEQKAIKLPKVLIFLGYVNEIKGENVHYYFPEKSKVLLATDSGGKRLFAIGKVKKKQIKEEIGEKYEKQLSTGVKIFQKWHDFDPSQVEKISVSPGFLFRVDRCSAIVYTSDKWEGKKNKYLHEFKTRPLMKANNKTKPSLLVLTGGKIRVTEKGITG